MCVESFPFLVSFGFDLERVRNMDEVDGEGGQGRVGGKERRGKKRIRR
jgi:hypothetical protein